VALALVVAGCGGRDEYPQEVEASFMTSCLAQRGASATSCRCFFDGLEEEFSYDEFKKFELAIVTRQRPPEEIGERLVEAITDCLE